MKVTAVVSRLALVIGLAAGLAGCRFSLNPASLPTQVFKLPFGQTKISFDELTFDARLGRVIVPAGETGALALVDPATQEIQVVQGFSRQAAAAPVVGAASAVSVQGNLFVLDRAARKIQIIDTASHKIVGSAPVETEPDYIRYISATNELWVTEPGREQIEVFHLVSGTPPSLEKADPIAVINGPEGLLLDQARGLVYTNQPKTGTTAVIQVMTHNIIYTWGNGCSKARGLALDQDRGILFVACNEGKLVLMDINHDGLQITSQNYGGELDFVAYNPNLKHVYLPSAASAIVAIYGVLDVPPTAQPTRSAAASSSSTPVPGQRISLVRLGTADTALKASCITVDNLNNLWICDPNHAQLFIVHDSFPPSGS